MTSRKLLWMTLGVLGVPLLIEGSGGCGFQAFPSKIIRDNAYNCGCVCGQPTTRRVAASADDVEQAGVTMTLNGMDLDLGAETVGLRFANAMIPAGANVLSARVQFAASAAGESAPTALAISAELSTNAATFTAADNDLGGRTFTPPAGDVAWPVDPWVAINDTGPAQQTPDVGPLVQQLVDRAGWTDASAMVLRFAGTGQRSAVSFDASNVRAAVLSVTFASVQASLPICATPDIIAQDDSSGALPQQDAAADCAITATATATDTCDTTPTIRLVSIVSNEPDNGLGDGDQPNDIQGAAFGTDDRQFQLRRERGGTGSDRVYTITYSATDDSGNATIQRASVTVPH